MSKESFSEKISETMYKKLKAIEYYSPAYFLEHDENFEIALCLAYMTLSKEKIIDKEMKNKDRLGRLTKHVDMVEINKVFTPGFAKDMPKIICAKENNNLWILDNIRDSIMHGVFEIDEERKLFLINNDQFDRDLIAEIPFSWFIAYAKNDILSKKTADKYTIRGFYYNKNKSNKNYLETKYELMNNILYRINITGNKFNIKDIKSRINELLDTYSKEEITSEDIEKYRSCINKERIKYNEQYLVSFYIASEKLKANIEKKFPGTNLNIYIDNNKHRFINQKEKRLPKFYNDYDIMFNRFNEEVSPKGINLLEYLSNIIEALDLTIEKELLNNNDLKDRVKLFNYILSRDNIDYYKIKNKSVVIKQNLEILRTICLNTYGLATLVINHETLYNPYFLNEHPSKHGIQACIKQPYLNYANKRKSLLLKILDIKIKLYEKEEQLNKCKDGDGKQRIQKDINNLKTQIKEHEEEIENLASVLGYEKVIKFEGVDFNKMQHLEFIILTYNDHFDSATNVIAKEKIRDIIAKLLEKQIELESEYTYSSCNNMKDVLTIIRNSFSHIGRITIKNDKGINTNIILNDYDNNGKTGEVRCTSGSLIQLLRAPNMVEEDKLTK